MKNVVILSPHIDDDVIGCFRLLKAGLVSKVYYFYDLTEERIAEAKRAAELFNFEPIFLKNETISIKQEDPETIFLVPNIHDVHPHHKSVNRFAKQNLHMYKLQYYSIDMNTKFDILSEELQVEKEKTLLTLYPSQHKLFANEKYFLFESLTKKDDVCKIWIKFQKEGIHQYPAALADPKLKDVSFLGYPHRHMFHFKVQIEVFHDDRDIEFIQFKRWCESLYGDGTLKLDFKSCEMLADELSLKIKNKYPGRSLTIEVSEDDENGCVTEYLA
jgi:hypothetical protein